MAFNSDQSLPHVQHDFQAVVAYVTGPEARVQTASTVELTLFRRLLALGAALLRLFFVMRAAVRPSEPGTAPDGMPLTSHDQRPTTDDAVFGNVRFWRHYVAARGQQGRCPLDAERRLPARCSADLRREWASYGATDEAYRERQTVLERILGLPLRLQALETGVAAAGEDVASFYEQPTEPTSPPPVGTLLVVQADGKGVPMVQPPLPPSPLRLGKGEKPTTKKEAVVTSLDTIAPDPRTPHEVVAALLRDPDGRGPAARPVPVGKERRATLEGKAVAMARLAERAAPRDGPHIQARVALTDGAQALPQQWLARFPQHT